MMGEVAAQGNLLAGDYLHLDYVGRKTFYGWLAIEGPRVYPDGDFREFYVLDNGRKSVPPSQMIRMVLLQWHDKVSDEEAVERTKYDLRWKTALGIEDRCVRNSRCRRFGASWCSANGAGRFWIAASRSAGRRGCCAARRSGRAWTPVRSSGGGR